jgi:hypothetical protein
VFQSFFMGFLSVARPEGSRNKKSDALARFISATYGRSQGEQLAALVMVSDEDIDAAGGDAIVAMGLKSRRIAVAFGLENEQAAKLFIGGLTALMPFGHAKKTEIKATLEMPLQMHMEAPSKGIEQGQHMRASQGPAVIPDDIQEMDGLEIKPNRNNALAFNPSNPSYGDRRMINVTPSNHSGKGFEG